MTLKLCVLLSPFVSPATTPTVTVTVTGWPIGTIVRGQRVMWDGELTMPATGEPGRFQQAL